MNHLHAKFLAPLAIASTLFVGCLETVEPDEMEPIKVSVYDSLKDFPKCTKKDEAKEAFAVKESALYICVSEKWKPTGHVVNNEIKVAANCVSVDAGDTVRVMCESDTVAVLRDGTKGKKGATGATGETGTTGEKGETGATGEKGPTGDTGDAGKNGVNNTVKGPAGDSCSAAPIMDGDLIKGYWMICGTDTVSTLFNGTDGTDGLGGETTCLSYELEDHSGYKIVCRGDSVGVILNGKNNNSYCDFLPLWDGSGTKLTCGIKKSDNPVKVTKYSWDLMNPDVDYGLMVDSRDGQPYRTVKIGDQTWMAENLNYAGTQEIVDSSNVSDSDRWSTCYRNNVMNCHKYGRYYRWSAIMDSAKTNCGNGRLCGTDTMTHVQGICPEGWHVPDTTEWNTLFDEVGRWNVGAIMSLSGWMYDSGTDVYGFGAYPGGKMYSYNSDENFGEYAYFASATESGSDYMYLLEISYTFSVNLYSYYKYYYYHLRCVKDE